MSRNVILTNLGPGSMKIEVQGRNARGNFEQKAEYVVKEGTFKSLTLDKHDSFQTLQLPDEVDVQPPSSNVV